LAAICSFRLTVPATSLPVSPRAGFAADSDHRLVIRRQQPPDSSMAASVTCYATVSFCRARHGVEDKLGAGDIAAGANCRVAANSSSLQKVLLLSNGRRPRTGWANGSYARIWPGIACHLSRLAPRLAHPKPKNRPSEKRSSNFIRIGESGGQVARHNGRLPLIGS
jgi:hypothetical protein